MGHAVLGAHTPRTPRKGGRHGSAPWATRSRVRAEDLPRRSILPYLERQVAPRSHAYLARQVPGGPALAQPCWSRRAGGGSCSSRRNTESDVQKQAGRPAFSPTTQCNMGSSP